MKKSGVRLAAAVMLGGAILALTSCFYMPGVSGKPAKAGINISRSLLPANVSSVALIVGGPGMGTIAAQYPVGTTSATLTVPSGAARTFTVLASTPSVTFRDEVTVDLAPGEAKEVGLSPRLFASQILVPDSMNGRVVQVSDMQGAGWQEQTGMQNPSDVDFDSQGRIYVACAYSIQQMDDIQSGTSNTVSAVSERGVVSIAVDRTNDLLYWSDSQGYLWRVPVPLGEVNNPEPVNLGSPGEGGVYATAIAADSDGSLYVADSTTLEIVKINPNPDPANPTIMVSYSGAPGGIPIKSPSDILANGDGVYVIDSGNSRILHLTRNLGFVDSISGHGSDSFLGPARFVAILNKPITVIDEEPYTNQGNRLVSFNDMTGAGWMTYEPQIEGADQFVFFYQNNVP